MLAFYLQQYVLFVAVLLGFMGLGWTVLRPFSSRLNLSGFFSRLYFYGLTGLTLFVTGFALYKSGGRTILGALLLFIPFLILDYLRQPREGAVKAVVPTIGGGKVSTLKVLGAAGLSLLIFTWEALAIAGEDGFLYRSVHNDTHFYGYIVKALRQTGQENFFHIGNVFDAGYHGVSPYHYFELWTAAAASEIAGTPEIPALYLLVYPTLGLFGALGFWALAEKFRLPPLGYLLLIVAFFSGGLYFQSFEGNRLLHEIKAFSWVDAVFSYPIGKKFLTLFAFLPAVALTLPSTFSFYVLLYLAVLSVAVLPAIAPAVGLCVLYLVYRQKAPRYWLYEIGGLLFLLGAYFLGFYHFFKPAASLPDLPEIPWPDSAALRTMRNIFVKTTFQFILFQSPFLGVIFFIFRYRKTIDDVSQILFGFYGCVFVLGLSAWAVAFRGVDSVQLFYAPACTLFTFIFLYVFIKYYAVLAKKSIILVGFSLYLGVQATNAWLDLAASRDGRPDNDLNYLRAIESARVKNENGVCFYSSASYQNLAGKTFCYVPARYATVNGKYAPSVHLSVFEIPIRDKQDSIQLKSSIFYRYCERLKNENRFIDVPNAQLSFVKTFNIGYAVTYRHDASLPKALRPLVRESFHDPVSGDTFYYFK